MSLRVLIAVALICGLLDSTAAINTAGFGIGLYIVASGSIGSLLILRSFLLRRTEGEQDALPNQLVILIAATLLLLWTMAWVQVVLRLTEPATVALQTSLRTILLGHFAVCVLAIRIANDQRLIHHILVVGLAVYICYGIYDLAAQVFGLPRFLNFLRNSNSVALTYSVGAQGWIQLPRIMSLASEPALTMMPAAIAAFIFCQLRGFSRLLLLALVLVFCVGTFARSIWVAFAGAICLGLAFRLIQALWGRTRMQLCRYLYLATVVLLPIFALATPFLTHVPENADSSLFERMEYSRASLFIFADHALTGVGFEGWTQRLIGPGRFHADVFTLDHIHNGVALYLAALGILGVFVAYLPMIIVLMSKHLTPGWKGWWVGIFGLSAIGGDYVAIPSSWTVLAVIFTWTANRASVSG